MRMAFIIYKQSTERAGLLAGAHYGDRLIVTFGALHRCFGCGVIGRSALHTQPRAGYRGFRADRRGHSRHSALPFESTPAHPQPHHRSLQHTYNAARQA